MRHDTIHPLMMSISIRKFSATLCMLLCAIGLLAQTEDVAEDEDDDIKSYIDVSKLKKEKLQLGKNAPAIDVAVEPREGDAFAYLPQPGKTAGARHAAQLSLGFTVFNNGTKKLLWEKVVYKYTYNGVAVTKSFITADKKELAVKPAQSAYWQNNRTYHVAGDVLFFEEPLPQTLTVELFFKDYAKPVVITKPLKPYTPAFRLPFKAEDLEEGEFIAGEATHGGNQQVYAYDLTIVGGKNGHLKAKKTDSNPPANSDARVYAKRVYAIADGEIVAVRNDQPENSRPGEKDGGKANEVVVRHGGLIMKYEHFKTGSINPALHEGAKVKAGDFLGLAGNSGRSSGPHLHICVFHIDGSASPLLFSNGYVTGRADYGKPGQPSTWIPLSGLGLPTEKSIVWPGESPPLK
jgi:hypothetical protein